MINIFAPVNMLGYGIHSLNMVKAFHDLHVDTNLTPIGQIQNSTYHEVYWKEASEAITFDRRSPSLHIFHDEYLHQVAGDTIAAFSVFETTKLSERALYNLKNVADMVFTTTERHKELLMEQGIDYVYVVNEGVDPLLYNTLECNKAIDTGKFTYITVGKCEERKNTDMIVRTFIETMQYKECALLLHTFNPFLAQTQGGKNTPAAYTSVNLESYGFKPVGNTEKGFKCSNGICDIYLTFHVPDITSLRSLYRSANVGIAYSRAEGWDLPLIELMACGIPTIASNVIGHSEYLPGAPKIQQDLVVEPKGMCNANDGKWFKGDRGDWHELDDSKLADLLEDTYDEQDKYKKPNKELSNYYHENYNWSLPAKKVSDILS